MRRILAVAAVLALGVAPARADEPLKVVFISGSFLYNSDEVLGKYKEWLEDSYPVSVTIVSAADWDDLPGLEALDDCDVALFYTRRLRIDGEQLQQIRQYVEGGRPVVAVRTASHGFENWPEFDKEVLGGDYQRHFEEGPVTQMSLIEETHPVLDGIEPFTSVSTLYRNPDIAADCTVLLNGTTKDGTQPVAWTRERTGRVFYTSLGGAEDFEDAAFRRLIANGLYWAASSAVPSSSGAGAGGSRSENK